MADDDDLDMNSLNDLSSSSFPPMTSSISERQQIEEHQVDDMYVHIHMHIQNKNIE